jgi:hypothetical protein
MQLQLLAAAEAALTARLNLWDGILTKLKATTAI